MSRFNLLDEPWIAVVSHSGSQSEVSITDLFHHAQDYVRLAGETRTQDFAVMRVLLAILQTVFSRYNVEGKALVPVDGSMRQVQEIEDDEEERDCYLEELQESWKELWDKKSFPEIVFRYLDVWHDRFYLFDEQFPFYQVTREEMQRLLPMGKHPTAVAGRFFNRTISESANKQALFSPVANQAKQQVKDSMTSAGLARWLITFQGYTGLSDKVTLFDKKSSAKPSRGWLFDLGGLYLEGGNLFETLLMNLLLVHPVDAFDFQIQKPCWEFSGLENAKRLIAERPVTNLAELYTNWSRAVYADPNMVLPGTAEIYIGKLPSLAHADAFLEPMTVWKFNTTGDNKDHYTPRKHMPSQAMWRSFGLIALGNSDGGTQHTPGIVVHLNRISRDIGNRAVSVRAVSMQDDNNATSWLPVDEIADQLQINDLVISDSGEDGWVVRINNAVEKTKKIINYYFGNYLKDIVLIRHMESAAGKGFVDEKISEFYQNIDIPFRNWLSELRPATSKETAIVEWYRILKKMALTHADRLIENAGTRDYIGIEREDGCVLNIVTAYQSYVRNILGEFPQERRKADGGNTDGR